MRLIEQFIQSKDGRMETCEDGYVFTEHFAAVIDGATNKSGISFGAESPGRVAMTIISDAIKRLPPDVEAFEAFPVINAELKRYYQGLGIYEAVLKNPSSRSTASCVIYSARKRQLWFLGDCMTLVDRRPIQYQKGTDRVLADLRALLIHIELSKGSSVERLLEHDTCREQIIPFLNQQALLQNSPYACEFTYHVLDGINEDVAKHVQIVQLDGSEQEIVLSSDGYPELLPTLEETEAHLRRVLREDPLCYTLFRSTKGMVAGNISFDDRAYLRFIV